MGKTFKDFDDYEEEFVEEQKKTDRRRERINRLKMKTDDHGMDEEKR